MPLTRRYTPPLAPGETSVFGLDFSTVIPKGVGIETGTLHIYNVIDPPPVGPPASLVTAGDVQVLDRTLYATVTAQFGASGQDFQLLWIAHATDGSVWPRTALVLCAETS